MKSNNANNKYYNRDMQGFYETKRKGTQAKLEIICRE